MSTDAEGQVTFFHCLIFHEKYNLNDLKQDFVQINA